MTKEKKKKETWVKPTFQRLKFNKTLTGQSGVYEPTFSFGQS